MHLTSEYLRGCVFSVISEGATKTCVALALAILYGSINTNFKRTRTCSAIRRAFSHE